ncbi:MAG: hypothetical protein UW22_C0013G0004 [Candidatus Gottesmanbacteria bacterium GW2011_GWB1_44_11c]|uniref:Uncharacterized protein n=2 Tax=Candidatus Gottesmaniibacteriota TaxID=1752720 RepID=A0A0G1IN70_9BACT|nr:MAG: hypothetical protein UW22_C0013G0004 [Candidatus Gottesmanbacteria bacterium GW2011_GWB1_44_11c]KKT60866.1 MAG: hypothetical protein UW52_C0016G0013 [Candidatus Gottesmanbacteria bacterium GW2011_GWA1_44_24b]HCM82402.1 hypothetical protein [Patescibacteria group bacterium]
MGVCPAQAGFFDGDLLIRLRAEKLDADQSSGALFAPSTKSREQAQRKRKEDDSMSKGSVFRDDEQFCTFL